MGSVPVWEEDGVQYCQSNAILRMLGIRFGYYTTDADVAWEIDSLLDYMEENFNDYIMRNVKQLFGMPLDEVDDAKFIGYFKKMITFLAGRLERFTPGTFIAGTDTLTIADLKVYHTFVMLFAVESNPVPQQLKDQVRQMIDQSAPLKTYLA